MYGMNNYINIFYNERTNFFIDEAGLSQSKYQMSIYYKYAPDGSKLVVLFYVDDCVYFYISE